MTTVTPKAITKAPPISTATKRATATKARPATTTTSFTGATMSRTTHRNRGVYRRSRHPGLVTGLGSSP